MKTNFISLAIGTMLACGIVSCRQQDKGFTLEHQGDTLTTVYVKAPGK